MEPILVVILIVAAVLAVGLAVWAVLAAGKALAPVEEAEPEEPEEPEFLVRDKVVAWENKQVHVRIVWRLVATHFGALSAQVYFEADPAVREQLVDFAYYDFLDEWIELGVLTEAADGRFDTRTEVFETLPERLTDAEYIAAKLAEHEFRKILTVGMTDIHNREILTVNIDRNYGHPSDREGTEFYATLGVFDPEGDGLVDWAAEKEYKDYTGITRLDRQVKDGYGFYSVANIHVRFPEES